MTPSPGAPSQPSVRDRAFSFLAILVWIAFGVFCVGASVSTGLSYADDATFARVAKSLISGLGYSFGDVASTFEAGVTTGPTLIIPCAVALKLAGVREAVPGLTAIAIWFSVLSILFSRVAKRLPDGLHRLLATALFCYLVIAVFPFHFEHWHAFLGETTAAALLLLGHWSVTMERLSRRWLCCSGLSLGLAVQAKNLAVIAAVGAVLVLLIRLARERRGARRQTFLFLLWATACIAPTAAFELFKLCELGVQGYAENWNAFSAFFHRQAFSDSSQSLVGSVIGRFRIVDERFLVTRATVVMGVGLTLCTATRRRGDWSMLLVALCVSIATMFGYWLFISIGWPRYLIIAVTMGCFAIALCSVVLLDAKVAVSFAVLTGITFWSGIGRFHLITDRADRGLFRLSTQRVARGKVVDKIRQLQRAGTVQLGSRWVAEYAAVEFCLPVGSRFTPVETIATESGGRRLVLINRMFPLGGDDDFIRRTIPAPMYDILVAPPYELRGIEAPRAE